MVALAITESTQYAKLIAVPSVRLDPLESHGRIRTLNFDWANGLVAGDAGGVISICKLPAGRVAMLGLLSTLYHNMTTGSNTILIGWAAYTDLDGDAVVADPNGLDNAISVETAGNVFMGTVLVANNNRKIFESQAGVVLTVTSVGVIAASDVLEGSIAYVLD